MIAFLLVFLGIFAPVLNFGGTQVDTQALYFLALVFITVLSGDLMGFLRNRTGGTLMLMLAGIAVYGFLTGLLISPDRGIPHAGLRVIRALITFLGCFAVLVLVARRKRVPIADLPVLELMFYAIVAHGVIMVLQFFLPGFREAIYAYTVDPDAVKGARYFFSMAGLTNGGGAQLSVYQATGLMLFPLVMRRTHGFWRRGVVWLCGLLVMFSVFITGRSGLLIFVTFLPLLMFMTARSTAQLTRRVVMALAGVLAAASLLIAVDVNSVNYSDDDAKNPIVALSSVVFRAQSVFFGDDNTLQKLATDHLVLPDDPLTITFGIPRLIENDQNFADRIVDSDIGYIRLWFGYGVVGSLLHYLFYVYGLLAAWTIYRRHDANRDHAAFAFMFGLAILFFHFKEVFVLTRIGFSISCYSLVVLAYQLAAVRRVAPVATPRPLLHSGAAPEGGMPA